ncbi:nicotinate-nucleotide adenylyltransferase [Thermodesulfatator atlanticus]|uniref:nicotinate-nucleotide adenylyltransferase n=1 Tax=Thermodesulfatator atlanticus TaxID=501497 RepID=UPI0003B54311|nr:nicotinate-nucleotide adenylyltransferase [Thermodesulfatator atlanticus]
MKRVGLLGGTFDPIHFGHLRPAEEVYEKLKLDKIIFIPAGTPPHKKSRTSPFALRFEMARLAIEGVPHFEVSDLEGKRKGPSYSVITLKELLAASQEDYFFILGLDAFLEFDTWFSFREIPRLVHLVVINRGEGGEKEFRKKVKEIFPEAQEKEKVFALPNGKTIRYVPVTRLDISSTMIREAVSKGKSIRFLLPEAVRRFILAHGLYDAGAREDFCKNPE